MGRPPSECYPLPVAPVGDSPNSYVKERTLVEMEADEEERIHKIEREQDLALDDDLAADEDNGFGSGQSSSQSPSD